jgi:hypothetical protein
VLLVPSPQLTVTPVRMPSGSVALIVSVMGVPVGAELADSVKLTTGALSVIVMLNELLVVSPASSVAFTWIAYEPARVYAWLSLATFPGSVSVAPSPQETVIPVKVPSGSVALMLRVRDVPVGELVLERARLTAGGLSAMRVIELVDPVRVALSVTVRVTV